MQVIAHGIDLVEISRIAAVLERHGERFIERCFTDGERAYADLGGGLRAQRYAARFAAKEAVFKCLGTGWTQGVEWRDVDVRRDPAGAPFLAIGGRGAERAANRGIAEWTISMTHSAGIAVASVIATGPAGGRPVG